MAESSGYAGAALTGVVLGAAWTPCIGPIPTAVTGSFTSLAALLARYTPEFLLERL